MVRDCGAANARGRISGPGVEPGNAAFQVASGGEHDHGNPLAGQAAAAALGYATLRYLGQQHIQDCVRVVQAAGLEALRPVLACGGQAVLEVKPRSHAVLLCLRGGAPAGVLPLWQALARQSGGAVVFDSGAQFAAAAFLPLCPGCRIQKSPSTQELLEDRFSLPYLFLSGYCAGPW